MHDKQCTRWLRYTYTFNELRLLLRPFFYTLLGTLTEFRAKASDPTYVHYSYSSYSSSFQRALAFMGKELTCLIYLEYVRTINSHLSVEKPSRSPQKETMHVSAQNHSIF